MDGASLQQPFQSPTTPYSSLYGTPQIFSPTSPIGGALGRPVMGPEVQLSGKHEGLCFYLTRLLRPLWNVMIAVETRNDSSSPIKVRCKKNKIKKKRKKNEGAPGIEPGTSRSAVECSTTELYPLVGIAALKDDFNFV